MQPRIVITGTDSGVGKTTVTLGLMAAFVKMSKKVQGFKCGPDYLDPTFHSSVTGRLSHQLDSWMLNEKWIHSLFVKHSKTADISIIEGMMGFYDGHSSTSNRGSTYEISSMLKAPVILVVDISHCARSAAAMVKGYQTFAADVNLAGVILNRAGSEGHAKLCQEAIEQMCNVLVVGYLKTGDTPTLPERHLGLIPALERGDFTTLIDSLAEVTSSQFDLEKIEEIARDTVILTNEKNTLDWGQQPQKVRIAVAYDAAFHFYYEENISLLKRAGAEIVRFSPLDGEGLPPNCHGLYLGGGFPEEYVQILTENVKLKRQLQEAVRTEMPIFAECGGYMYLAETIMTTDGKTYPMTGIIPMEVKMQPHLAAIGYREVTTVNTSLFGEKGTSLRGHEFHYSTASIKEPVQAALTYIGRDGYLVEEGYQKGSVLASYIHLHMASNSEVALEWIKTCNTYKQQRESDNDDPTI